MKKILIILMIAVMFSVVVAEDKQLSSEIYTTRLITQDLVLAVSEINTDKLTEEELKEVIVLMLKIKRFNEQLDNIEKLNELGAVEEAGTAKEISEIINRSRKEFIKIVEQFKLQVEEVNRR